MGEHRGLERQEKTDIMPLVQIQSQLLSPAAMHLEQQRALCQGLSQTKRPAVNMLHTANKTSYPVSRKQIQNKLGTTAPFLVHAGKMRTTEPCGWPEFGSH